MDIFDFSSILDNSLGGIVRMPISIPITYDNDGTIKPLVEPYFFDKEGK